MPVPLKNVFYNRLYQFDRCINRRFNSHAQTHLTLFASERFRLAAHEQHILDFDIHCPGHAQHAYGIHSVGFNRRLWSVRIIQRFQIRFDDV